ncbi:MAG: SWIM zinc finger family protein [Minicystis sp.]
MKLDLRYLGSSEVRSTSSGAEVRFSPNLARSRVFFDAELAYPLRFREAVSALHDVVVGDLRFKKKDKTAYLQWKKEQAERDAELRRTLYDAAKQAELARIAKEPLPPNLESDFRKMHRLYWDARVRWANELARNDPELFRHLVPCDPVVTVADDVVFFECFSKDESAYGCLSVDRGALRGGDAGRGTTNVDYSLALYEHFQTLRSYRSTRLLVDPMGFEVKVEGREDYREEKIDLPPTWLRGFGQLQAAMTLPSRKVELPVEAVYAILAHLKRHRERTGPRSIRFQLTPGRPPVLVLDPWGVRIECRGPRVEDAAPSAAAIAGTAGHGPYRAPPVIATAPTMPAITDGPEEIKVWGRRRLFALARVLPICDRVEVRLLGSGLPSIWIAHLGEMRFVLALSGWTANDWSSGSNLSLLAGAAHPDARVMAAVQQKLFGVQHASADELAEAAGASRDVTLASLHELAKHGQAIYDFAAGCYRYREVMPFALSEAVVGPEHPELAEGKRLASEKRVKIRREEALSGGRRLYVFEAGGVQAEAVIDGDGVLKSAKCSCSFFFKNRLRAGPCRHVVGLRLTLAGSPPPPQPAPPPIVAAPTNLPAAAPQKPAARGPVRREDVVSLAKDVAAEIRTIADDEDKGISDVVEDAWDLAFERLQACQGWKDAIKLIDPKRASAIAGRSVSDPVQQTVLLHEEVLREIALVAQRFGASPSAVVNLAWLVTRRRA